MAKRTTVTFDDHDQGVLASVSNPDRAEWAVLVEAAAENGITLKPGASEAAIIRALVHAGAGALRERALERGYAELADLWPDVHDVAETRERRRRYAHRVDRRGQSSQSISVSAAGEDDDVGRGSRHRR